MTTRPHVSMLGFLISLFVAAEGSAAGATPRRVQAEIAVGGPGGWDYTTFDPHTHRLYIAHGAAIAAVNVATKAVTAHLADAQGAHIAVPFADGTMLMITHGKANQVTLNDAANGAVLTTIAVDAGPDAAVIEPVTGHAFVMANAGNMVDVIDLKAQAVIARIPAGGAPEAAAEDDRGLVFTHLEEHNAIVVIDAKTQKVRATYAIDDCQEPSGIAAITGKDLILSACHNNVARITNASTGAEVAKLPLGSRPDSAFYDATRQLGFVPCGDGTLTVISFASEHPSVVEVVATQAGARTGAVDSASGLVYLPTAELRPPAQPGGRPTVVPDSLKVVVIGN